MLCISLPLTVSHQITLATKDNTEHVPISHLPNNNGRFLKANYIAAVTFAAEYILSLYSVFKKYVTVKMILRMSEQFLQCSMEMVCWSNPTPRYNSMYMHDKMHL